MWDLSRPREAALPSSYFWTWDHSTNWVLDDPGNQTLGCHNAYLKRPETYLEDYRRLTDFAAALGVRGILIWGFLRDAHGGVDYGKRVAGYARDKGVAILPGFGTTWYGGAYYEGDSPYSLVRFLEAHPDARMQDETGAPRPRGACPAHPAYREWLASSLQWLYKEFDIGGINLENGDMMVDFHPLTQAERAKWPSDDPEAFFFQGLSYIPALEAISELLPDSLGTYATYTGFGLGEELHQNATMGKGAPAMLSMLPEQSICQWTLTGMVSETPVPLTAFLDDGAPSVVFENPRWPTGLRASASRNVGFVHQGSQWCHDTRHQCVISTIKEACLRAYRSGLEGVSIHGEVSALHIPYALNYLAFSHFIHWPEDSLREFGRKTLGPVLGSEACGETFAELLARWDAGTLTEDDRKLIQEHASGFGARGTTLAEYEQKKFWHWLRAMSQNRCEKHTVSLQT